MKEVCKHNIENINLMIDNMLDDAAKKQLESHISSCSSCMRFYNEMLSVKNSVSNISLKLPADFSKSVMKKIEDRKKEKSLFLMRNRIVKYAVSAVAACLVIAFSIVLVNQNLFRNKVSESASLGMVSNNLDEIPPEYSGADNGENELMTESSKFALQATADTCSDIDDYDYLLSNESIKTDELIDILTNEFKITEYQQTDECLIFSTDLDTYGKVLDKLRLRVVEENISRENTVTVKILNNNGG